MKFQKKKLVPYTFFLFSIFISTFLWEKIKLPFEDPLINGIYSENKYHSFNDILRYMQFIFFPLSVWFISYIYINKKKFDKFIYNFNNSENYYLEKKNSTKFLFLLIFSFLILEFLSLNFPIQKLDLIHEGQQLSSAFRNYLENTLWSNSYVTVGIFYETINAKLFWNLFDNVSIGLLRYSILLYILFLKILFLILTFKITNLLKINNYLKSIFLFLNSIIIINFIDYDISSSDYISYREIPLVLGLIFITDFYNKKKNHILYIILLTSISFPSLIWGVDRGLVYNIILLSLIFYLLIVKDYKNFFFSILSLIIFWFIFFIIFKDEFKDFVFNTLNIYNQMNYIHGIIHPIPFTDEQNSSRSSKTLLIILFSLIISIKLFFNSNKKFSNQLKFTLLFISILSCLSYLYALGRSDGPHIKESFGYPLLFLTYFFLILFFNYINIKLKDFHLNKLLTYALVMIFSFFIFDINAKDIFTYNKRFDNYKNIDDKEFLKSNEIQLINKLSPLVKNYKCIQLFSNDVALLYLLRKKSCSKFYFTWSVGSYNNQKKLIKHLEKNNLIIVGGESYNWDMPISKKLPLVQQFIEKNYNFLFEINEWKILVK